MYIYSTFCLIRFTWYECLQIASTIRSRAAKRKWKNLEENSLRLRSAHELQVNYDTHHQCVITEINSLFASKHSSSYFHNILPNRNDKIRIQSNASLHVNTLFIIIISIISIHFGGIRAPKFHLHFYLSASVDGAELSLGLIADGLIREESDRFCG